MNYWLIRAPLLLLVVGISVGALGDCGVEPALVRLQEEVTGPLTLGEQNQARQILASLCIASPDGVAQDGPAANAPVSVPGNQEAPDTTSILGVEFRKADADSKGHDRLKKH